MGATLGDNCLFYESAASETWLPLPAVDLKHQLESSLSVPGIEVIRETGAPPADGRPDDLLDSSMQANCLCRCQSPPRCMWWDTGVEKGFIHIDVTQAGHKPLTQ